ncbi:hypothetical protein M404DRAFT_143823 [Pisolithus tinctorius Marx 270]|uniref:Uncharacterized protein n=1 Tax=Pisolithus tinctorius Marx 270 TaxID=870435 RepID=A0A0C3P9T8_PISTI|nr:hypothetical protein M404DRAFT_143823 [Pisolithus tinctorius Marx 270]
MLIFDNKEPDEDIATQVQLLLEQFFNDMLQESLNKKATSEGSWTNIPPQQQTQEATETLYQSFALPFLAAQYIFCTGQQWDHSHCLFPSQLPTTIRQNFHKCMYYHKWLDLIALLGVQTCNRVQAAIRQKFSTLVWIPFTGSDRIWCTGPMTGRGWFTLPEGHPPAGPQIALNLNLNARHLGLGKPFLWVMPTSNHADDIMDGEDEDGNELPAAPRAAIQHEDEGDGRRSLL